MIKQMFKVEPEPGQSDSSGSSQIPRLWAALAPGNTGSETLVVVLKLSGAVPRLRYYDGAKIWAEKV